MSPRDMRKTPWISPEMLPAARVGALVPTPGVLVELASCGDRAEGPQSHQIVDRHGEGKHPADTVAAAMPRLAKQTDRLEPPEHFLDPLADSLAHAVARVASRRASRAVSSFSATGGVTLSVRRHATKSRSS